MLSHGFVSDIAAQMQATLSVLKMAAFRLLSAFMALLLMGLFSATLFAEEVPVQTAVTNDAPVKQTTSLSQQSESIATPEVTSQSNLEAQADQSNAPESQMETSEYVKKLMTNPDGSSNSSNPVSTTQLATTVAGLFAVIGMIFVAAWLVRRLSGGQIGSGNSTIKVIANHPLGTKEKLCLIDVAGQQILVGMTAQSMQTLLVLDEPVDIQKPKAWASESVNSVFGAKLQSILKGAPVNEGKQSKVDD